MMNLTLDALTVLDAIARQGSFAAAATELGKVPSALTYTVRRLEETLDVLIFDRRGKRALLTPAGSELLEQGRLLLRAADDLACRVKEVASGWEVELRIALDGVIAFERISPLLADFYHLQAPTRLRFSYEVLDGGWDALLSGRADLAIGVSAEPAAAASAAGLYAVRPLGEVRFIYCVAPHHPLAVLPEPLEADVLVAHRAIAVANSARQLPPRSAGLLSGQDTLTVATLEQKVALQLAGLGAGYLPEAFARPHLTSGQLVERQTARPLNAVSLHYAWRRTARGKALTWWLNRLAVARVRRQLLASPSGNGADTVLGRVTQAAINAPGDARADRLNRAKSAPGRSNAKPRLSRAPVRKPA